MERSSTVQAGSALVVVLLLVLVWATPAVAAVPVGSALEVALLDGQGGPVVSQPVVLERSQAGRWQPTSTESLRTDREGTATVAIPAGGPASYRLRIEAGGTPTFAHRFDVAADGSRSHYRSDHLAAVEPGRIVFMLTHEDPWPGLHDPVWLVRVNQARAAAGLGPLTQRVDWHVAAGLHADYILATQQPSGHFEDPTLPEHTLAGHWATSTGNLMRGGALRSSAQAVQLWLNSPGHAAWILHPGVRQVGYAQRFDPDAGEVRFSAVMPISEGVDQTVDRATPVTYPAPGAVLEVGEQPDARCDEGRARLNATCAVHLRRDDLRELAASTRFDAQVWVNGRQQAATVDAAPEQRRLSVMLADPLPANATVRVRVDADGLPYESWQFTTRARTLPHDIPAGSVHAHAIEAVMVARIATGYPDGSYRPHATVTRGHMASLLAAALRLPSGPPSGLADIQGSVHATAISALVHAGIATGYPDGTFRPELPVTRGQIATMLAAGLDLDPSSSGVPVDAAGNVHAPGIGALIQAGIITGYPDGRYAPDRPVDRSQMASLLARAFALLPE